MTARLRLTVGAWNALVTVLVLVPAPSGAQEEVAACGLCDQATELIDRFGLRESPLPVRDTPGWAPPVKIVTLFGQGFADLLSQIAPGAEVIGVSDTSRVAEVIAGADVYVGMCTPEIIDAGQDLKYIHIVRAGADTCASIPAVAERGILVTNMQRMLGPQIADHAMALLLSLTRRTAQFAVEQSAGVFSPVSPNELGVWRLEDKIMLVIGLGGIGVEVARRANGFGMRVHATRNSSRDGPDFVEYVGLAPEALELAASADVVVNATPLTPATTGMFDAEFFGAMKETAYFINVGRGQSAVTADLVAALESGAIAGAGLDVVDPEPLPPGHPLWGMSNVVLTPHVGGISDRNMLLYGGFAAENVRRYAAGMRVVNVVDLRRGY